MERLSKQQFLRSWLHEMKSLRNAWAHWPSERIDYRMASRAYDTLALVYLAFNGNPENALYFKIETSRRRVLLESIREGERKGKRA